MSIYTLKQDLGVSDLTMQYEEGGAIQVFRTSGIEVRIRASASHGEVCERIRELLGKAKPE